MRATLFAIFTLVAIAIGAAVILYLRHETFGDYVSRLRGQAHVADWASRLAGLLALVSALFAAASAWIVWYAPSDLDDAPTRRTQRFVPVALGVLALILLWLSTVLMGREPPPATPTTPVEAPPPPEPPLAGDEAPTPQVSVLAVGDYVFKYPLIADDGVSGEAVTANNLAHLLPLNDPDGHVRGLFCGKAWVALAGAASQEGAQARNETRARARTKLAVARARTWLNAHVVDCPAAPVLLGLDLGQHAAVIDAPRADGADTADQRAVIVIARPRRPNEAALTAEAALAEARAYFASPEGAAAILNGRRYDHAPGFIAEGDL